MKYLKHFEKYKRPQVGEYVICKDTTSNLNAAYEPINDYLENHIGKIIQIKNGAPRPFLVQYDFNYLSDVHWDVKYYFGNNNVVKFSSHDILFHSKNKEDLEMRLTVNKYNI
jgi:hypothetical protein